jgi:flagellar basal-body rod modification protein FlgD
MTTITGNSAIDALASGQTAKSPSTGLDQSDFLKLMTTQLKTQDPFNPVDNTQMVAQMAQFSSVAGISEMNQSLKSMAADIAASRVGDASNWIGRSALVSSDVATPLSNGAYAGEVDLPDDATDVSIGLMDANGAVVHSEALGAQTAGTIAFAWDGKDAAGNAAATGPLKLVVNARGEDGTIKATSSTWTGISGVQSPASGATKLVTPLGLLDPAEALRLS